MTQQPLLFYTKSQMIDYIKENRTELNAIAAKKRMNLHIDLKQKRIYYKTLDERLIQLAYRAAGYVMGSTKKLFKIRDLFTDPVEYTDFQKVHYFNIFERTKHGWKLTPTGIGFLTGSTALSQRLGVLDNEVVERSKEKIRVENAEKRWQTCRQDYCLDSRRIELKGRDEHFKIKEIKVLE